MSSYTQDGRFLAVTTPLGKDVLLLRSFSGHEEMSRLFRFELDMLSENADITPQQIVGKSVTWQVQRADLGARCFNGYVSRLMAGGSPLRDLRQYRAEVVPWLWFLTRTADCRIFQNKTVPQIIEQIFKDLGFSAYELKISGTHPVWEYCVQYRETDFRFVSRLMEQEGIFYYFRHEQGKHTLVLADQRSAYVDCIEKDVEYEPQGSRRMSVLVGWEHQYEFRPGKYAQTDYCFETPSLDLMTTATTLVRLPGVEKYEIYDYPGEYEKKGDGQAETKVRMEEQEVPFDLVAGQGNCATFTIAGKFKLKRHPSPSEAGKAYVLTSIDHSATEPSYDQSGDTPRYANQFVCIPEAVTFRPARSTPKARVEGPQTALVVGPKAEEIYTDKYGRVKVQFYWDREGKKDENSSCWIRVAENWAGKNWGIVFNPRIGQEVIVDFLEGDPDRPIITGRVYNAEQMPPYALPTNQTKSTIQTRSSKGGTTTNFNELRFEDLKGSEEIYFHAEKDFNRVVENNDTLKVGSSDTKTCPDGSQTITIYKNRTETVQTGNETVTIEKGNRTITVSKGNEVHEISKGTRSLIVEGDTTLQVRSGNHGVTIDKGNDTLTIKQGNREVSIDTGNDTLTIKKGNQTIKLDLGKTATEAMQSIELKVGQSSIKLEQAGVTIKGMTIKIEGQMQTQLKGLMTEVSGSAMLQAKGGIVMIN